MNRIRIILADDYVFLMDAVRNFLEPEYEVVGTFTDGHALVTGAESLQPDIVILDVGLLTSCHLLRKHLPKIKIIFLTTNEEAYAIGEAFRAGASGYVLKTSPASELLFAIKEVLRGGYFATASLTDGMIGSFVQNFKRMKAPRNITGRQKDVLRLLVEGRSMKQVARVLNISPRTVAFHKYTMMDRLNLHSGAELISYALTLRATVH